MGASGFGGHGLVGWARLASTRFHGQTRRQNLRGATLCERQFAICSSTAAQAARTRALTAHPARGEHLSNAGIFNQISYQLGDLKRPAYIVTLDSDPHQHDEWDRRGVRAVCLGMDQHELALQGHSVEASKTQRCMSPMTAWRPCMRSANCDRDCSSSTWPCLILTGGS